MNKRYAILGMGTFGRAVVEEMLQKPVELVIADKDEAALEEFKDRVTAVFVADLTVRPVLEQIMPRTLDGCVIDFGDNMEATILVTHYLRQMGLQNIMVPGKSASHGEILGLLGAATVVDPAREAARRMVPRLINDGLLSYTPLGRGLSFAEIPLPGELVGVCLREARFRERFNLNVIAARTDDRGTGQGAGDGAEELQYRTLAADYAFVPSDILLVSGSDEAIDNWARRDAAQKDPGGFLRRILKKKG